jgi:uncharacterized membrane protein YeaQ/YmgE (transglycosylase-associated protein family)
MNVFSFVVVGLLAGLLARASLPTLGVLAAWKSAVAGLTGAVLAGALGSLLAQENPWSLVTFGPVGLALAAVGAGALLLALESAQPPGWP